MVEGVKSLYASTMDSLQMEWLNGEIINFAGIFTLSVINITGWVIFFLITEEVGWRECQDPGIR